MPTGYLGPLWAKTGRPLYSPGQDKARTLPGPNRSALSVPRHIFKLNLCQALTLPGGGPPTLVPEAGAVLRPRMEGRSRFKNKQGTTSESDLIYSFAEVLLLDHNLIRG